MTRRTKSIKKCLTFGQRFRGYCLSSIRLRKGRKSKANQAISNVTNSTVGYATVRTHTAAAGLGVSFSLSSNIGIATGTSLVLMDKASSIYVEEGRSITVQVNPINTIHATCSYERIQ